GAFVLEVNAQRDEIFNGQVGNTANLTSLTTDATGSGVTSGGKAQFNFAATSGSLTTASVVTTTGQTYNDAVQLGAKTILDNTGAASDITFGSTVNGAFALEVNAQRDEFFNAKVGNTAN